MNLITQGLDVQAMTIKANTKGLSKADRVALDKANLKLVYKPDPKPSNIVDLAEHRRVMAAHTSPEAA
jgi:hypothetical protein